MAYKAITNKAANNNYAIDQNSQNRVKLTANWSYVTLEDTPISLFKKR